MKQLILGGQRSGKSALAESLAEKSGLPVTTIATAKAGDEEMRQRIKAHQARRPSHWITIEEPLYLARAIEKIEVAQTCIIVDCLTLWLTNLLLHEDRLLLDQERCALREILPKTRAHILFVSNETNMGITPTDALSRRFCDETGHLHQQLAQICERVILTVAGLPQLIKGDAL